MIGWISRNQKEGDEGSHLKSASVVSQVSGIDHFGNHIKVELKEIEIWLRDLRKCLGDLRKPPKLVQTVCLLAPTSYYRPLVDSSCNLVVYFERMLA
ncbi:hypothetical protein B9Z55_025587 [Caenorhabditis nigoni]|uniref:Uncharacterized protein n=1 Tax=Caenorhabditis nigoni TaxID=1611254 RepID=A0A2G5SZM3_9PELO|nr:hypothetical protein B9Z55_025587 [Caenorhabditis nigoni]